MTIGSVGVSGRRPGNPLVLLKSAGLYNLFQLACVVVMMPTETFTFKNSRGQALHAVACLPAGGAAACKAVLVFGHGYSEHTGRKLQGECVCSYWIIICCYTLVQLQPMHANNMACSLAVQDQLSPTSCDRCICLLVLYCFSFLDAVGKRLGTPEGRAFEASMCVLHACSTEVQ
jgi:hypothetical protein